LSFDYLDPTQERHKTRSKVREGSLLWFWGNVYSQAGQDGILREIFERLAIRNGVFVEFGAWDGRYLSNCRLLFEKGWSGVFIEADPEKFAELQRNYRDHSSIHCVNEYVGADNPLDAILRRHMRLERVDFVSIDIDGLDLDVALKANLRAIGAKVVLIEGGFNFDPRLATRVPEALAAANVGQPIAVMIAELKSIGYEAVCFFQDVYLVRADLVADRFAGAPRDPVTLYEDAWNFSGDNLKQVLAGFRESIRAETFERAANLEFMKF
jgi:hypothetical protein